MSKEIEDQKDLGSNVAWTNAILTIEICSRCFQEPNFKVSSKSAQLELRYCWYWVSVVVGWWVGWLVGFAKQFSCQIQLMLNCHWVELGLWQCYQVSKLEMELQIINIIYTALPMHEQIVRQHFHAKCKTLQLYWSGLKGHVHWQSAHSAGHIPGIFSLQAAYSALRHFLLQNEKVMSKKRCF